MREPGEDLHNEASEEPIMAVLLDPRGSRQTDRVETPEEVRVSTMGCPGAQL
jgi:hypothetical protein